MEGIPLPFIVTTPDGEEYDEIIEIGIPIPKGMPPLPKTYGFPAILHFLLGSAFVLLTEKKISLGKFL